MSYAPTIKDRQSKTSKKTHSYNNNEPANKSSTNNNSQQRDTLHYQTPISSIQDISKSIKSSSTTYSTNNSNDNSLFQPKLRISRPGDVYEQEADRIAEKVMAMHSIPFSYSAVPPIGDRSNAKGNGIDKKCSACEMKGKKEEEEKEELNISLKPSAASSSSVEANDQVTNEINTVLSGSSSSFDANTKEFMESKFGYDLSNVRIHTDAVAAKSAESVNALAYTVGNDIVFGEGQYHPDTIEGRRLLAHELTHVVQQRRANFSSTIQMDPAGSSTALQQKRVLSKDIPPYGTFYYYSDPSRDLYVEGRKIQSGGRGSPQGPTWLGLPKVIDKFGSGRRSFEAMLEHYAKMNAIGGRVRPFLKESFDLKAEISKIDKRKLEKIQQRAKNEEQSMVGSKTSKALFTLADTYLTQLKGFLSVAQMRLEANKNDKEAENLKKEAHEAEVLTGRILSGLKAVKSALERDPKGAIKEAAGTLPEEFVENLKKDIREAFGADKKGKLEKAAEDLRNSSRIKREVADKHFYEEVLKAIPELKKIMPEIASTASAATSIYATNLSQLEREFDKAAQGQAGGKNNKKRRVGFKFADIGLAISAAELTCKAADEAIEIGKVTSSLLDEIDEILVLSDPHASPDPANDKRIWNELVTDGLNFRVEAPKIKEEAARFGEAVKKLQREAITTISQLEL